MTVSTAVRQDGTGDRIWRVNGKDDMAEERRTGGEEEKMSIGKDGPGTRPVALCSLRTGNSGHDWFGDGPHTQARVGTLMNARSCIVGLVNISGQTRV